MRHFVVLILVLISIIAISPTTTQQTSDETDGIKQLSLLYPPPIIYQNGPGKCKTNTVKCREFYKLDWCVHFCIWIFQGYLMLNVSFSVFIIPTDHITYELGVIETHPDSVDNPPDLNGFWMVNVAGGFDRQIQIQHFRYSSVDDPHLLLFSLKHNGRVVKYVGNIVRLVEGSDLPKYQVIKKETRRMLRRLNDLTSNNTQSPTKDEDTNTKKTKEFREPMFEIRVSYNDNLHQ